MTKEKIPAKTLQVFARSIHEEARRYGFSQVDVLRLINELMDLATGEGDEPLPSATGESGDARFHVDSFPLRSTRLEVRLADREGDAALLSSWLRDEYGRHFLISSASAQAADVHSLLDGDSNQVGIVYLEDTPVGAVAFLDIDSGQKRAELRKLIGEPTARGKGLAEEATRLWIEYGGRVLGLKKIYVSTMQTHIRNIQLNERIGFRVEGLLQNEVLIGDQRYDVLRMGYEFKRSD